jgi:hypothetical protein
LSKKNENENVKEEVTKPPIKTDDLKTLTELVEMYKEVGEFKIFMNLSKQGYMQKYFEEQKRQKIGFENEPIMTEKEFKKIIGE